MNTEIYADGKTLIMGREMKLDLSTLWGRMGARAYAYAYRAYAENLLEGERVFKEIIKIVGERENS